MNRTTRIHPCLALGAALALAANASGSVRPYPRYATNHESRIDLIYTDGHPRNINNSIYHLFYQGGNFLKSDGSVVKSLANLPLEHDTGERGTIVYPYTTTAWGAGQGPDDWIPNGRAWTWDIHYQPDGKPVCVFQVQVDGAAGPATDFKNDRIYYYYARWDGSQTRPTSTTIAISTASSPRLQRPACACVTCNGPRAARPSNGLRPPASPTASALRWIS